MVFLCAINNIIRYPSAFPILFEKLPRHIVESSLGKSISQDLERYPRNRTFRQLQNIWEYDQHPNDHRYRLSLTLYYLKGKHKTSSPKLFPFGMIIIGKSAMQGNLNWIKLSWIVDYVFSWPKKCLFLFIKLMQSKTWQKQRLHHHRKAPQLTQMHPQKRILVGFLFLLIACYVL